MVEALVVINPHRRRLWRSVHDVLVDAAVLFGGAARETDPVCDRRAARRQLKVGRDDVPTLDSRPTGSVRTDDVCRLFDVGVGKPARVGGPLGTITEEPEWNGRHSDSPWPGPRGRHDPHLTEIAYRCDQSPIRRPTRMRALRRNPSRAGPPGVGDVEAARADPPEHDPTAVRRPVEVPHVTGREPPGLRSVSIRDVEAKFQARERHALPVRRPTPARDGKTEALIRTIVETRTRGVCARSTDRSRKQAFARTVGQNAVKGGEVLEPGRVSPQEENPIPGARHGGVRCGRG